MHFAAASFHVPAPVATPSQTALYVAPHAAWVSLLGVHLQPVGTVAGFAHFNIVRIDAMASAPVWGVQEPKAPTTAEANKQKRIANTISGGGGRLQARNQLLS